MPRVITTRAVTLYPRAECLGDNPDRNAEISNCAMTWPAGPMTIDSVKHHVKAHPTHEVLVVRETRSVYGMVG